MKRLIIFLAAMVLFSARAEGQTLDASQFAGNTLQAKVEAAQTQCQTGVRCVILIPPHLSVFTRGTLPVPDVLQMFADFSFTPGITYFTNAAPPSTGGVGLQSGNVLTSPFLRITGGATTPVTVGAIISRTISTGSIAGVTRADVVLTWSGAGFADANYTVTCTVLETSALGLGQRVERIRARTATTITVQVMNDNAGALTGTVHCIAIHD